MTQATSTLEEAHPTGPRLQRRLGRIGLLFASVGSIIGSGWLFGALNAARTAGPAAIISWTLGGIIIMLIGLCFAELGTMFPLAGGVVRFPHIAFGSFASFVNGWIMWVATMAVAPIEVEGALQYATKYFPFTRAEGGAHVLTGLGLGTAVVLMAVFVVVNYVGIHWFQRINNVLVWWKLAMIILVIIAFGVTAFHGSNFTATSSGFFANGWTGVFSAIATSGIVFSYLGFRQGIELAGETSDPRRNVPFAVIGSVVVTMVLYILLQVVFIGALPANLIPTHWADLSFANDFGPLAAMSSILGLVWLEVLLYIDAIVSPADTGLIYTTVTARVSFAMGRTGGAPSALSRTTSRGAPIVSLLVTFVVGLILFLPFPSWQQMVGFVSSATVLSFGAGPLAVVSLRRQIPDYRRPFRLRGLGVISFLGFLASNLIVFWTGWDTNWKLFVAVLLGFVLLAIQMGTREHLRDEVRHTFRHGAWVLPWLVGLALISWLDSMHVSSPLLYGLTLLLSIGVYWMAFALRLPPEEVVANIEADREESLVEEEMFDAQ
ncbi:MAG TPA: APC family permease [Propionibacteriaceae bacterium]|nr:APC family permease [Propionibacteriaceae bacterium]